MNRFFVTRAGVALASLLGAAALLAMTVLPTDFNQLLNQAEQIYKAQVVSVTSDWTGVGANRHLATFVRLRVLESYRGAVAGEQTLEFFGGSKGARVQGIFGMPQFHTGDVEILFVRPSDHSFCPLVGVQHGRFRVVSSASDKTERVFLHDGTPLKDVSRVGTSRENVARGGARQEIDPMPVADFVGQIRAGLKSRGLIPDAS